MSKKVMCCLCFHIFSIHELNITKDGSAEDVCVSCAYEEKKYLSCRNCHYSKNGKTGCNRMMDNATPKIDLLKGAECSGNGYAHWVKYTGVRREI